MEQNKDFSKEIDEKSLDNEKNKKVLVILIAVLLFAVTYYYYSNQAPVPEQATNNTVKVDKTVEPAKKIEIKQNKAEQQQNKQAVKKEEIKKQSEEQETPIVSYDAIHPTDKASLLKLAFAKTGMVDPFASKGRKSFSSGIPMPGMTSLKPFDGKLPTIGNLPLPPGYEGLPSLNGIPSLNPELNKTSPMEYITVKGFIGDKVIVSINGITDSLKVNESFQDIKVVRIDPVNLTAKFERKGLVISKTIKSLTDKEENPNVELVRYKQKSI